MVPLVAAKHEALARLCRRFRVRRLELFGSATAGRFDDDTSDLDFLVEFDDFEPAGYADAYFGLLEELQAFFERDVDFVVIWGLHLTGVAV